MPFCLDAIMVSITTNRTRQNLSNLFGAGLQGYFPVFFNIWRLYRGTQYLVDYFCPHICEMFWRPVSCSVRVATQLPRWEAETSYFDENRTNTLYCSTHCGGVGAFSMTQTSEMCDPRSMWYSSPPRMNATGLTTSRYTLRVIMPVRVET